VRSLRGLLLVNQSTQRHIPAPSASALSSMLTDLVSLPSSTEPIQGLLDILEVADAAMAPGMTVFIDQREHRAESLFSPLLGDLQGPALTIFFDQALSWEEVIKLQSSALGSGQSVHASCCGISLHVCVILLGGSIEIRGRVLSSGHGLSSAYQSVA
jgi:hypothetical protein